jgi:hypothetical protein
MTAFPSYSTGTVAVAANATVIIGASTIWSGVNVRPGDEIVIAGNTVNVVDVTDTTHLVIDPWPYAAVAAGAAYKVYQKSPLRFVGGQVMVDVSTMVGALNTDGFYVFVPSTLTAPDPSLGNNGQYAFQATTGKLWQKVSGAWSFLGIYKAFGVAAPWSGATAYGINDVATLAGSSYVCILAHTNFTPPNATYWNVLAAKGDGATVAVGTVTTGAGGSAASVTNSGTSGAAVLNFTIPQGSSYAATSTTSFLIGTGSKAFTTQAGLAYVVGSRVRTASNANGANYMEGLVTAYSGATLTINITSVGGSGTFADWNLSLAGDPGAGNMSGFNNLSELTNKPVALNNLGAAQFSLINGRLVESHAANAATFAIKTALGADPSATDPVSVIFSNGTSASLTAALSVTIAAGAVLGSTSGVPFRLWFAIFNNAGTLLLGVRNCSNSSGVSGFGGTGYASTANDNQSGQVTWTNGTVLTWMPYVIVGFADYDSGMPTAGTWINPPTRIILFGPHTSKPGDAMSTYNVTASGNLSTSSATPANIGTSKALTPSSLHSLFKVDAAVRMQSTQQGVGARARIYRDSTAIGADARMYQNIGTLGIETATGLTAIDRPATAGAITYAIFGWTDAPANTAVNIGNSAPSSITITELMG